MLSLTLLAKSAVKLFRHYLLISGMHMLQLRLHTEEKILCRGLCKRSISAEGSGSVPAK